MILEWNEVIFLLKCVLLQKVDFVFNRNSILVYEIYCCVDYKLVTV